MCTTLSRDGKLLIESEKPVTCEVSAGSINCYLAEESVAAIGVASKPRDVFVNGESMPFTYDPDRKAAIVTLRKGGFFSITK